jgi:ATP-dependent Clp protease protease subunit
MLAKNTGQKKDKIENDMDRDFWLDAEESKKYGLVDKVFKSKNDLKKKVKPVKNQKVNQKKKK